MAAKVTILPPTFFHGDPAIDTLTATTFYREIKARMVKEETINTDAKRIAYVVEHLRDDAWDWWENITRTTAGKPLEVFKDFEKGFCSFFDVTSLNVNKGLDTREVDRQRTTEHIHGYYNRVAAYFNNRLPITNYISERDLEEKMTAYRQRHPEATVAQCALHREDLKTTAETALLGVTDALIRKMWVTGLHPQFKQTALTMDDPDKSTINMLDAMRRRFPNSRLSSARNVAPGEQKTKKAAVAAIKEDNLLEDDEDDGEVAAFKTYGGARGKNVKKNGQKKGKSDSAKGAKNTKDFRCNYCGIFGHREAMCRKKNAQVNASAQNKAPQRNNVSALTMAEAAAEANLGQEEFLHAVQAVTRNAKTHAIGGLGRKDF